MKKQEKGLETISRALPKEHGGCIPTSVISEAMDKAGFAEYAQGWLSQQGQYYCVCMLLLCTNKTPNTE